MSFEPKPADMVAFVPQRLICERHSRNAALARNSWPNALAGLSPAALKEGGHFHRDGAPCYSRRAAPSPREGKTLDHKPFTMREIAAMGIKSLKVRYNSVFGLLHSSQSQNRSPNVPGALQRGSKPLLAA